MTRKLRASIALITEYELNRERQSSELNSLELSLNSVESSIQTKKTASLGKLNQQETATVNQRIIDIKKEINDLNNADPDGKPSKG